LVPYNRISDVIDEVSYKPMSLQRGRMFLLESTLTIVMLSQVNTKIICKNYHFAGSNDNNVQERSLKNIYIYIYIYIYILVTKIFSSEKTAVLHTPD